MQCTTQPLPFCCRRRRHHIAACFLFRRFFFVWSLTLSRSRSLSLKLIHLHTDTHDEKKKNVVRNNKIRTMILQQWSAFAHMQTERIQTHTRFSTVLSLFLKIVYRRAFFSHCQMASWCVVVLCHFFFVFFTQKKNYSSHKFMHLFRNWLFCVLQWHPNDQWWPSERVAYLFSTLFRWAGERKKCRWKRKENGFGFMRIISSMNEKKKQSDCWMTL